MKSITKILGIGVLVLGSVQTIQAQASASATAEGKIITPITLIKSVDLNFGNVAVNASPGTVTLPPAGGTPNRSYTGGVTLPSTIGTVSAAQFDVGGEANFSYAITLPPSVTVGILFGPAMLVNNFTSLPSGTGTLDGTGADVIYVGARLNVDGAQQPGSYSSMLSPFPVTVNYN